MIRGLAAGLGALLLFACGADAATLRVGAGRAYTTLQAASDAANPGDIIEIDPGTYTSGATWYDSGLIIRRAAGAPPGSVTVRDGAVGGKGLFVIKGANITVDGLSFENAAVPSLNGAGIRNEAPNLTVLNSVFVNNEMGILDTGPTAGHTLTVRGSRFEDTRSPVDGANLSHGIYVAAATPALVVEDSVFVNTSKGHHLKSRAVSTTVKGSTFDDADGDNSFAIDVPQGGRLYVEGNIFIKGANSPNEVVIAYGFERYKGAAYRNPMSWMWIADNELINWRAGSTVLFKNVTGLAGELSGNVLRAEAGTVRLAEGAHSVTGPGDRLTPIDAWRHPSLGGYVPEFDAVPVPVAAPPVAVLLAIGLAGLAAGRRRRT